MKKTITLNEYQNSKRMKLGSKRFIFIDKKKVEVAVTLPELKVEDTLDGKVFSLVRSNRVYEAMETSKDVWLCECLNVMTTAETCEEAILANMELQDGLLFTDGKPTCLEGHIALTVEQWGKANKLIYLDKDGSTERYATMFGRYYKVRIK